MSDRSANNDGLLLNGLDGANPLAFLAALGTLRLLGEHEPSARLCWRPYASGWCAVLYLPEVNTNDQLLQTVLPLLNQDQANHPARRWESFRDGDAAALRTLIECNRDAWSACIGIEPLPNTDHAKRFSQLQTARQDYHVKAVVNLLDRCYEARDLHRTFFRIWDYGDPLEGLTLHLDPSEDRRHAYQWTKPIGDPTRKTSGNMIVANRLALEAFPLFPCVHDGPAARTVGFQGHRVHDTFWTWPIWNVPVGRDTAFSMLTLPTLQDEMIDSDHLRARGIAAVCRAQRILVGKTPNITPSRQIA